LAGQQFPIIHLLIAVERFQDPHRQRGTQRERSDGYDHRVWIWAERWAGTGGSESENTMFPVWNAVKTFPKER
jgi:hypothetical protein